MKPVPYLYAPELCVPSNRGGVGFRKPGHDIAGCIGQQEGRQSGKQPSGIGLRMCLAICRGGRHTLPPVCVAELPNLGLCAARGPHRCYQLQARKALLNSSDGAYRPSDYWDLKPPPLGLAVLPPPPCFPALRWVSS